MGLLTGIKRCVGKMTSAIADSVRPQGMRDKMLLELPGVKIRLERCTSDDVPHEVTLVLPRIEIRRTTKSAAAETIEEYVYSSVTVVHAPRHPEEGRLSQSMHPDAGRQGQRQSMYADAGQQGQRQSMHPEEERRRPGRSMDNTRAMLYTLRRWPAQDGSSRPDNATRGKEADNRVLDRRDAANR